MNGGGGGVKQIREGERGEHATTRFIAPPPRRHPEESCLMWGRENVNVRQWSMRRDLVLKDFRIRSSALGSYHSSACSLINPFRERAAVCAAGMEPKRGRPQPFTRCAAHESWNVAYNILSVTFSPALLGDRGTRQPAYISMPCTPCRKTLTPCQHSRAYELILVSAMSS